MRMKESYVEGVAAHNGLESCGVAREGGVEALTGETAGWVWSREMLNVRGADAVEKSGRQHGGHGHRRRAIHRRCRGHRDHRSTRRLIGPVADQPRVEHPPAFLFQPWCDAGGDQARTWSFAARDPDAGRPPQRARN